jgi:hypothetical protein
VPVTCRVRSFSVCSLSGGSADWEVRAESHLNAETETVCEAVGVGSGRRQSIQSEFDFNICGGIRTLGARVAQLVEALRYKSEGRGFDFRWCHWIFY